MPENLIWSWTLQDTKDSIEKYDLPLWVEKVVGIVGLSILLYISVNYISPVLGGWFNYVIGIITLLGLYLVVKKIEQPLPLEKQAYLKIYNDGVAVNLVGFTGFYESNKIDLESLEIKRVFYGNNLGFSFVKGLCFNTRDPTNRGQRAIVSNMLAC